MDRPTPLATEGSAPPPATLPGEPLASGEADAEAWLEAQLAKLAAAGVGPVASATLMELAALGVDHRISSVAAAALEMARQLDSDNSATAKSMCAGRLQEALDRLLELHPPRQEGTPLDEITERREARIAAAQN